jgi:hypothetical protein
MYTLYRSFSEPCFDLLAACHGALLDGLEHVTEVTAQLLETGTDDSKRAQMRTDIKLIPLYRDSISIAVCATNKSALNMPASSS